MPGDDVAPVSVMMAIINRLHYIKFMSRQEFSTETDAFKNLHKKEWQSIVFIIIFSGLSPCLKKLQLPMFSFTTGYAGGRNMQKKVLGQFSNGILSRSS